ncbi:MAG TPA: hypothetical protein V6C52_02940 [Coleofasciculaceae cyanobacterium]|jgi:hypothetical protein
MSVIFSAIDFLNRNVDYDELLWLHTYSQWTGSNQTSRFKDRFLGKDSPYREIIQPILQNPENAEGLASELNDHVESIQRELCLWEHQENPRYARVMEHATNFLNRVITDCKEDPELGAATTMAYLTNETPMGEILVQLEIEYGMITPHYNIQFPDGTFSCLAPDDESVSAYKRFGLAKIQGYARLRQYQQAGWDFVNMELFMTKPLRIPGCRKPKLTGFDKNGYLMFEYEALKSMSTAKKQQLLSLFENRPSAEKVASHASADKDTVEDDHPVRPGFERAY